MEKLTVKDIFYKFKDVNLDSVHIHTSLDPAGELQTYTLGYWTTLDAWGTFIRTKKDIYNLIKDSYATYEIIANRNLHIYIEEE